MLQYDSRNRLADDRRFVKNRAATAGLFRIFHRLAPSEIYLARVQVNNYKMFKIKKGLLADLKDLIKFTGEET